MNQRNVGIVSKIIIWAIPEQLSGGTKMKNKFFILLLALVLMPFAVMAQRTVTGVVVDANTQQPLIGASLYWKNTTAGATSSVDGTFSILVNTSIVVPILLPSITQLYINFLFLS